MHQRKKKGKKEPESSDSGNKQLTPDRCIKCIDKITYLGKHNMYFVTTGSIHGRH